MTGLILTRFDSLTPEAAGTTAHLWAVADRAVLGHADFAWNSTELLSFSTATDTMRRVFFLVHDGDRPVGMAKVSLPQKDNRHLLELEMRVDPQATVGEVLAVLWGGVEKLRCEEHRGTIISYHPPVGECDRWYRQNGFDLVQQEIASTLHMPAPDTQPQPDDEYDILTFTGATPDHLLDQMARLRERMSTDIPLGGMNVEPEVWDTDRIRAMEAKVAAAGRTILTAAAIHRATGEAVAYTTLETTTNGSAFAFQSDTLVRREDRGHRLGQRIKQANLDQLAREFPQVERVHTWNAEENSWMLHINDQLGFEATSRLASWQRDFRDSPAKDRLTPTRG